MLRWWRGLQLWRKVNRWLVKGVSRWPIYWYLYVLYLTSYSRWLTFYSGKTFPSCWILSTRSFSWLLTHSYSFLLCSASEKCFNRSLTSNLTSSSWFYTLSCFSFWPRLSLFPSWYSLYPTLQPLYSGPTLFTSLPTFSPTFLFWLFYGKWALRLMMIEAVWLQRRYVGHSPQNPFAWMIWTVLRGSRSGSSWKTNLLDTSTFLMIDTL